MRVHFPNLERPKKAARRLSSQFPNLQLHRAQKAVARAVGYANWHELESSYAEHLPTPLDQLWIEADFRQQALRAIGALSDELQISAGDALYALSNMRLTGDRIWKLEDHTMLRIDLWRRSHIFSSARRSRGSVVRVKGLKQSPCLSYVCSYGQPTRVLCDLGVAHCADFEVTVPRKKQPEFLPARLWQPYGVWRLKDGSEIVFSRDYFPLWRVLCSDIQRLPPWLWIEGIQNQRHFLGRRDWMWWDDEARTLKLEYLSSNNISGLPILSDILPLLLNNKAKSIEDAVAILMSATAATDPAGPWHRSWRFERAPSSASREPLTAGPWAS
jgi:hypothetical protein